MKIQTQHVIIFAAIILVGYLIYRNWMKKTGEPQVNTMI